MGSVGDTMYNWFARAGKGKGKTSFVRKCGCHWPRHLSIPAAHLVPNHPMQKPVLSKHCPSFSC